MKQRNLTIGVGLLVLVISSFAQQMDGRALYQQNCAACHGDTGKGGSGPIKGPRLVGDASNWNSKLFARAVLEGVDDGGRKLKSGMPHWKNSSFQQDAGKPPTVAEVEAIHKYLRTVK